MAWMFVLALGTATIAEANHARLAVIGPAPDFALTTQAGEAFQLTDLKGRIVLISFLFTTCNGTCPATTHRLCQVQHALKERGLTKGGRVQLLSITLDPERDSPEVLRRYMKLYAIDPAGWWFLTGSAEQVKPVLTRWGMWAKPAANGQLDHPSRVFLVDATGRIREIYNLDFLKPEWVVEDVRTLLEEVTSR